ncbi:MAG: hypothetical protein H0U70_04595 [Tatlockia sp.]|nr:hypothetical protein [Tatlockia sp.]
MKKILMLVLIVASTATVSGCGFSNCGYSTCTSCCNVSSYGGCCGSNGWY